MLASHVLGRKSLKNVGFKGHQNAGLPEAPTCFGADLDHISSSSSSLVAGKKNNNNNSSVAFSLSNVNCSAEYANSVRSGAVRPTSLQQVGSTAYQDKPV
jgi:hypothetical protein